MAAEIVGTAFVAIRAITSGISDDIKDGLDKGSKDAKKDSEKSGKMLGEDMGAGLGEGLGDTLDEEIPGAIKDSSESQESKKASDESGRSLGQRLGDSIKKHFGVGLSDGLADSLHKAGSDNEDDSTNLGDHIGANVSDSFHKNVNVGIPNAVANALKPNSRTNAASDEMGKSLWTRISDVFHNDAGDFGSRMGDGIGKALGGIGPVGGTIGLIFLNLLPLIAGVAQVAIALIGGIVAALGYVVTAAAGAGVALAGVGAALGVAVLPILLAFKAETPALEHFQKVFETFKESWLEVGAAAQEGLLPALEDSLANLQDLIPRFKEFGKEIGFSVGRIAKLATAAFTSDKNLDHMGRIMAGSVTVIDHLGRGVIAVFDALLPILNAAMPAATKLAESIGDALEHFNEFIQKKSESGELTATFDKWYDRLSTIGAILGNVFTAIWNIFSVGGDVTEGMFKNLEDITAKWEEWTGSVEGKNSVKDFFDNALAISTEVFGIIGDIFKMLVQPLIGATSSDGIVGVLQTVRNDILPVIGDLVALVSENAAPMLGDLFDALAEFIGIIGDNPELAVGIFAIMGASLWILTAALEGLNLILQTDIGLKLAGLVVGFAGLAKVLSMLHVLSPLMGLVTSIIGALTGPLFTALGTALAAVAAPVAIVAAVILAIVGALLLLYFHFQPFRDLIDDMVDFVAALDPLYWILIAIGTITFGPVVAFFAILTAMKWDEIVDGVMGFVDTLVDLDWGAVGDAVLEGLGSIGRTILDKLYEVVYAMPGLIRSLVQSIIGAVQDLPSRIGTIMSSAITSFTSWLGDVLPRIAYYLGVATGTILRWIFWEIPNAIISAIPDVIRAFVNLMQGIITFLIDQGPTILRTFWDIIVAIPGFILSALDGIVTVIVTVIGTIPSLIVTALATFGSFLVGVLEGAWPGAKTAIERFLTTVVNFFIDLPGRILTALSSIGSTIAGVFSGAWSTVQSAVSTLMTNVANFFIDLPGNIVTAVGDIGAAIGGLFTNAWTGVQTAAQTLWDNIVDFFTGLPGAITRAISGVASALATGVKNAFKTAWNTVIDGLPELNVGGWKVGAGFASVTLPRINLDPSDFLRLAHGAIVSGPTFAMIGEAGSEAVIPLTNPIRARQLLAESGLDQLVIRDKTGPASIRTGAALHIEHATFNDPVTADIVAAKVMAAIRL